MKAAISYRCVCGHDFLVCVDEGEPLDERLSWLAAISEVAATIGATFVHAEQRSFACPACGTLHAATRPVAAARAVGS